MDAENAEAMVWADAAYQSRLVDSALKEISYESQTQEKGRRQQPLSEAAKARNLEWPRLVLLQNVSWPRWRRAWKVR